MEARAQTVEQAAAELHNAIRALVIPEDQRVTVERATQGVAHGARLALLAAGFDSPMLMSVIARAPKPHGR